MTLPRYPQREEEGCYRFRLLLFSCKGRIKFIRLSSAHGSAIRTGRQSHRRVAGARCRLVAYFAPLGVVVEVRDDGPPDVLSATDGGTLRGDGELPARRLRARISEMRCRTLRKVGRCAGSVDHREVTRAANCFGQLSGMGRRSWLTATRKMIWWYSNPSQGRRLPARTEAEQYHRAGCCTEHHIPPATSKCAGTRS